jgi:hypothetical protein
VLNDKKRWIVLAAVRRKRGERMSPESPKMGESQVVSLLKPVIAPGAIFAVREKQMFFIEGVEDVFRSLMVQNK